MSCKKVFDEGYAVFARRPLGSKNLICTLLTHLFIPYLYLNHYKVLLGLRVGWVKLKNGQSKEFLQWAERCRCYCFGADWNDDKLVILLLIQDINFADGIFGVIQFLYDFSRSIKFDDESKNHLIMIIHKVNELNRIKPSL